MHKSIYSSRAGLWLTVLVIFGALLQAGRVSAAQSPVQLVVGGRPALFEVPPYLDANNTVMAPVEFVRLLGASFTVAADGTVTITSASGKAFSEASQFIQNRFMVPVQATAMQLGASLTWSPDTETMSIRSRLEVARVDSDNVIIATSYPVYYKTQALDNPSRLVVDIFGADLDAPPAEVPTADPVVTQIRSGQFDDQTVRLVLDLAHPTNYQISSTRQTNAIKIALNTGTTDATPVPDLGSPQPQDADAGAPAPASASPSVQPGLIPLPSLSQPSSSQQSKVVDVEYRAVNGGVSQVIVTTAGPINVPTTSFKAQLLSGPNRLEFDVNNAVLALTNPIEQTVSEVAPETNPLFNLIRWGFDSSVQMPETRVVLNLVNPILYTVTTENLPDNSGVRYIINIQQNVSLIAHNSASNNISGKIVIVDAGHGGHDSGALGRDGICEKSFTLNIAKYVRDALAAAGATPIMTRSDDTFIPLDARSQLGIDSNADYFISVHCDSSGSQNSHSGDTVYYHGNNEVCRDLARSIANRLSQLEISIPSDGIRSDYVRFPGIGYSVLRKSPEPAVLVECGYVNDDSDAQSLQNPATLQQIAGAIVAGLRDYVANR